jgi:predicted PurR-regulated permease PerM
MSIEALMRPFALPLLVGVGLLVGVLWLLGPVLSPFLVAGVLAYALHPAVERLVRWGLGRVGAVVLVEVVLVLAFSAVFFLLLPILLREIPILQERLPQWAAAIEAKLRPLLRTLGLHWSLDVTTIKRLALEHLNANTQDWVPAVLNSVRLGGNWALTVLGYLVLVPVVLFYFLMDWTRLWGRAALWVPRRWSSSVTSFVAECDRVLAQYLRGQLMLMLVLSLYYTVSLALFGFDLALPLGVLTGLAVFIPYLGFFVGLLLSALAAFLQFEPGYALLALTVVFGVGQLLESFVLTPRLIGERIGLGPLSVIFALMAFGQLFGFVGVLVALPVSAILVVSVRFAFRSYRSSVLYRGR